MTFIFFGNYLGQQQLFICIYLGPVTFILLIGASDIFYTFIDFRPAIFIHTYFIWGQLHFFLHVFISGQRHLFTFIHLEPATLVYVYLFASTDFKKKEEVFIDLGPASMPASEGVAPTSLVATS